MPIPTVNRRLLLPRHPPFTPWSIPGLLAYWGFDQGSGTQITDYSGNGNHGTFAAGGSAPTWSGGGVAFAGSQYANVPGIAMSGIRSVIAYGKEIAPGPYNVILSGNADGSLTWGLNKNTGNYPPNVFFWVGGVGEGQRGVEDTFQQNGGQGCAWVQNGVADQTFVNGWPCLNQTAGAGGSETSTTGRTGSVTIGYNPGNAGLSGFTGTIMGMLVYSGIATATQVALANQYLSARAALRGLAPYASGFTGYRIWEEGDSITAGSTITTAPYITALGLYTHSYTQLNRSVSGNTIQRIAGGIRSRTLQQYGSGATRNILWLFAGTNDIYINGASAATTFGYLNQAVLYATSFGFQVVVCPMLSRTSTGAAQPNIDSIKNAYNALILAAAAGWGPNVYVIPASALVNLIGDGAYANTTYFSDGTHPTQTASDSILAPAFAAGVNSFG